MLSAIEQKRLEISRGTEANRKSQLGQFLTPARTAAFMAGLFPDNIGTCRLLDAGAGIGSLSAAFLDRCRAGELNFQRVELDAFEIDTALHVHLSQILDEYSHLGEFFANIHSEDFIHAAAEFLSGSLYSKIANSYTHAILNPPYKKINSDSAHRSSLRRVGIETVNLYSAFVALAVALSAPAGQIVAIIPRSFCNGPYYRPFRDFVLDRVALHHMHLFKSRNKAFKDDEVLQENVVIRLERGGQQGAVIVSSSTDDTFTDLVTHEHPFERIVFPNDHERFIHAPASPERNKIELSPAIKYSLTDLNLCVSTGPVVDFRLKEHLRGMPGPGTVPLLYPAHFSNNCATWPIEGLKKPNAIERNADTEKWFYPNGYYCVVRRFSSKEEKRRIVASVVEPGMFGDVPVLGFENHLNLFHENKRGLPKALAHGLAAFLNTVAVDENFRSINGHTQVNATDLKQIKYPSRAALVELGEWAMRQEDITESLIDAKLGNLTE